MAMSDCPKCWDTPCECGYGYIEWKPERRERLAKLLLKLNEDDKTIKKS